MPPISDEMQEWFQDPGGSEPQPHRRLWGNDPIPYIGGPDGTGFYGKATLPTPGYAGNPWAFGGGHNWDTDWGRFGVDGGIQGWSSPDPNSSRNPPWNFHPHAFGGLYGEYGLGPNTKLKGNIGGLLDIDDPSDPFAAGGLGNTDYSGWLGFEHTF